MAQHRSTRRAAVLGAVALAAALAGCGGVSVTAENPVPQPLVEELPLRAGLYYSAEFKNYAAHEERYSTKWQVELGAAHVAAIDRLTKAMFASVTPVADLAKLPATPLDLILEPRFEEFSFLTPRDSGGELFAVTIKYRVNIYDGQARLVDSLVLTGFGNEIAGSLSSGKPLAIATRKAMRDAGAKFAAELPDQPVIKKLVRHEAVEPIAQGSTAAPEGSIGEVQPTATKPVPPPAAPPAAPTPVPEAPTPVPEAPPAEPAAASPPPQAAQDVAASPAVPPAAADAAAVAPAAPATPAGAGQAPPDAASAPASAAAPAPDDAGAPPVAPAAPPAAPPAGGPGVRPAAPEAPPIVAPPPAAPPGVETTAPPPDSTAPR